jgi:hypothetical protein
VRSRRGSTREKAHDPTEHRRDYPFPATSAHGGSLGSTESWLLPSTEGLAASQARNRVPILVRVMVFAKIALVLSLVPSLAASAHVTGHYAGRDDRTVATAIAARKAEAAARRDRAIERKLLLFAPGKRALRRFVDSTTGLVKQNVAARCTRLRGTHHRHMRHRFLCRVWRQPKPASSGISVVCFTKHHVFRVTPYHRRHRRHRSRH